MSDIDELEKQFPKSFRVEHVLEAEGGVIVQVGGVGDIYIDCWNLKFLHDAMQNAQIDIQINALCKVQGKHREGSSRWQELEEEIQDLRCSRK